MANVNSNAQSNLCIETFVVFSSDNEGLPLSTYARRYLFRTVLGKPDLFSTRNNNTKIKQNNNLIRFPLNFNVEHAGLIFSRRHLEIVFFFSFFFQNILVKHFMQKLTFHAKIVNLHQISTSSFWKTSRKHANIILTPLNPTFTLFFLFLLKNIDCGYSLEPPRRGGSNEYPQSMF